MDQLLPTPKGFYRKKTSPVLDSLCQACLMESGQHLGPYLESERPLQINPSQNKISGYFCIHVSPIKTPVFDNGEERQKTRNV